MKKLTRIKDIVVFLVFLLLAAYASPLLLFSLVSGIGNSITGIAGSEITTQHYYVALAMISLVIAVLLGLIIFVGIHLGHRALNIKPIKK